ncbi:MAG: hypothetical protein ACFBSC_18855 [Microcoleaceae cyanobacterium]
MIIARIIALPPDGRLVDHHGQDIELSPAKWIVKDSDLRRFDELPRVGDKVFINEKDESVKKVESIIHIAKPVGRESVVAAPYSAILLVADPAVLASRHVQDRNIKNLCSF